MFQGIGALVVSRRIVTVAQHVSGHPRRRKHVGRVAHLVKFRSVQVAHGPTGHHEHAEAVRDQHGRIRPAIRPVPTLHRSGLHFFEPDTLGHREPYFWLRPLRILDRLHRTSEGGRPLAPFPQQLILPLQIHLQVVILILAHGKGHRF